MWFKSFYSNSKLGPDCRGEEVFHVFCFRYIFRKYLGAGAFGQVILADSIERKGPVAIKLLQRGNKITKHVRNEIVNHSLLKHPHVIAFHDLFLHGNYLCLALEYASGRSMFPVCNSLGFKVRGFQCLSPLLLLNHSLSERSRRFF